MLNQILKKMIVVLLGYMGSGKSTIGRLLASELGWEFQDLDTLIEQKENKSIPEIFQERGAIYFRKIEAEVLRSASIAEINTVLALGGGAPCYAGNMEFLNTKEKVVTIYLQLSIPNLVARLKTEKDQRPLIANCADEDLPEFIGKHLFERNPFYQQASITLNCNDKSPQTIVDEIQELLKL